MHKISIRFLMDGKTLFEVPTFVIPLGSQLRECYETEDEIFVLGWPQEDDESHNCDALGCSTMSHVLYRFSKVKL